jgi:hypothetical protein
MIFGMNKEVGSLAHQVRNAEAQLMRRQNQLHEDWRALDMSVRQRVTAPDVLLWSAGTGFIIGELTKKRAPYVEKQAERRHADPDARDAHEKEEAPGTLQLLLRYIAIARPIIATVSAMIAPYGHKMEAEAQAQDQENARTAAPDPDSAAPCSAHQAA